MYRSLACAARRRRPPSLSPPGITALALGMLAAVVPQVLEVRALGAEATDRPNVVLILADDN